MANTNICEIWAEKLAARHPDDLSPTERVALNAHTSSCPYCSALRQDYDLLTRRIRSLRASTISPSPPNPANAPWHTQQQKRSGRGRRNSEKFGQRTSHIIRGASSHRIRVGIALVAACILIVLLALFNGHSSLQKSIPLSVKQSTITAAVKGFTNVCPLPPDENNANCQAHYAGNYVSILDHRSSPMALFLQQKQKVISGSCTLSQPFNIESAPISGSVDEQGIMKFEVRINPLPLIIYFIGSIYTDGSISGTYTTSTGQQGTWTVKEA